jgi:hypothetical protein
MDAFSYLLAHPDFAECIPRNALVAILPEWDPELREINLRLVEEQREPGQPVVYVRVEALLPSRSRLVNPRVEVAVKNR